MKILLLYNYGINKYCNEIIIILENIVIYLFNVKILILLMIQEFNLLKHLFNWNCFSFLAIKKMIIKKYTQVK